MLKQFLSWVLAGFLVVAGPVPVEARPHRGGVSGIPASCVQSIDNGCLASPGGSILIPNLFSGYTGASYTRNTANMPCVDYSCGLGGGCSFVVVDPATSTTGTGCGQIPSGWRYDPPGITLSGAVTTFSTIHCTTNTGGSCAGNFDFKGFELGPTGGHPMTVIYWQVVQSGNLTVEYNHLAMDYTANVAIYMASQSNSAVTIRANTFDGQWTSSYSQVGLFTASTSAGVMTVTAVTSGTILPFQTLNANGVANSIVVSQLTGTGGAACPDVTCNGTTGTYQISQATVHTSETMQTAFQAQAGALNTTGAIDIEYNYLKEINSRPFSGQTQLAAGTSSGNVKIAYNFFAGFLYTPFNAAVPGLHGEVWEGTHASGQSGNSAYPSNVYQGNVCYQPVAVLGAQTACFYLSTGGNTQNAGISTTYTDTQLIDNVVINQQSGTLGGSALAAMDRMFYGTQTWTRNYIAPGTTSQNVLCTQAPFVGGVLNHAVTPYLSAPVVSGNMNMVSNTNIDATLITNDPGATGCLPF